MLATWSRTRQDSGTRRCISHISFARVSISRAAQPKPREPWGLGASTSTFFYTTLSAAGLAFDARAKTTRNKQWDKAFAQLNEALDQPSQATASSEAEKAAVKYSPDHGGAVMEDLFADQDWTAIQRIVGMDLMDYHATRNHETKTLSHAPEYSHIVPIAWNDLHFDAGELGAQPFEWPVNTGYELVRNNLPPQSLWAPDTLRLTAMRRRHTWKKLATQELSTGLLIHTLIEKANLPRFAQSAEGDVSKVLPQLRQVAFHTEAQRQDARKDFLETIEKLHSTHVQGNDDGVDKAMFHVDQPAVPRYYQDADGDFYDICRRMNEGIKHILQQTRANNDRVEALALVKICHNLLVSTAPPDLRTFNLLLSGFRRWRRPRLVDNVIAAFYAHKVRPNEVTCSEILSHYILESRPDDFSRFVARMRGVDDALMLANPSITVNEASHDRLVRVSQQKVLQRVHPTPMVFGTLIHGVLQFAGFERALDVYYEMKVDGWGLDVQGLIRLLRSCVRRADWEGGLYLWEEINTIKTKSKPRDMTKAYYHMLSLCSITGNTTAFNQILNEVARNGYDRKRIIGDATKLTRWAHKKGEYLAPAFAADNVLIAVSAYMNDAMPEDAETVTSVNSNVMLQHGFEGEQTNKPAGNKEDGQATANSKEAWASWVQHEFGERPREPEL